MLLWTTTSDTKKKKKIKHPNPNKRNYGKHDFQSGYHNDSSFENLGWAREWKLACWWPLWGLGRLSVDLPGGRTAPFNQVSLQDWHCGSEPIGWWLILAQRTCKFPVEPVTIRSFMDERMNGYIIHIHCRLVLYAKCIARDKAEITVFLELNSNEF